MLKITWAACTFHLFPPSPPNKWRSFFQACVMFLSFPICAGGREQNEFYPPPLPLSTPPPSPVHVKDANWGKTRERNVFSFRAPFPEKRSLRKEFFAHCTVHSTHITAQCSALQSYFRFECNWPQPFFKYQNSAVFCPLLLFRVFFGGEKYNACPQRIFYSWNPEFRSLPYLTSSSSSGQVFFIFLGKKGNVRSHGGIRYFDSKRSYSLPLPPPKEKEKTLRRGWRFYFFSTGKRETQEFIPRK